LNIDEYVFYILGLGYIDDFDDLSLLNILLDNSIHASRSLLILNIIIYLKNLTDYT